MTNTYNGLTDAFLGNVELLLSAPTVSVKGVETKELLHRNFKVYNPHQRVMILKHRNNNIFAQIAETLWVLAGRNDMEFLSHYLPRAPQWADNGLQWRAGYGPRLRNWPGAFLQSSGYASGYQKESTDQIASCVNLLKHDPQTRQAVISLWDPALDWVESRDIPCNNWLHFIIRDNRLHLAVAVRSNDVWWGFSGINFFEWSVLHEAMARWVGVESGYINWFASSFHLYEQYYNTAEKVVRENYAGSFKALPTDLAFYDIPHIPVDCDFETLDADLEEVFRCEQMFRIHPNGLDSFVSHTGRNQFLQVCLNMLHTYNCHLQELDTSYIQQSINTLPVCDMRVAAVEFMVRKYGHEFLNGLTLSSQELQFLTHYYA